MSKIKNRALLTVFLGIMSAMAPLATDMYLGDRNIVAVLQQPVGEYCREPGTEVLSIEITLI